ncbi:hypothetical protein ACLB2K_064919 [Fragaria x ananassa]
MGEYGRVHERVGVKRKRGQMKWECSPSGRPKIDIDGAFSGSLGSGGIEVVVRDETGLGIAAMARPFRHAHFMLNMEFEACRADLRLGIHQGWSDIDIEGDSILLIATLERKEDDMSEVGHVLGDCKDYLKAFQSVRIRHIYQEVNDVADRLLHLASLGALDDVWLKETPFIIHDVLYEDISRLLIVARGLGYMSLPMQNFNINIINEIGREAKPLSYAEFQILKKQKEKRGKSLLLLF